MLKAMPSEVEDQEQLRDENLAEKKAFEYEAGALLNAEVYAEDFEEMLPPHAYSTLTLAYFCGSC